MEAMVRTKRPGLFLLSFTERTSFITSPAIIDMAG